MMSINSSAMDHPYQIYIPIYHEFYSFTCAECGETFDEESDELGDEICPVCDSDIIIYYCDLCGVGFDHICIRPNCDQFELDNKDRFQNITYKYVEMFNSRTKLHQDLIKHFILLANEVGAVEDIPEEIVSMIASFMY